MHFDIMKMVILTLSWSLPLSLSFVFILYFYFMLLTFFNLVLLLPRFCAVRGSAVLTLPLLPRADRSWMPRPMRRTSRRNSP